MKKRANYGNIESAVGLSRPRTHNGFMLGLARFTSFAVVWSICLTHAAADPAPDTATTVERTSSRVNYWLPALEIVGLNIALNRTARLYGADFAKISVSSAADNAQGKWEWDNDRFTTNQFRHPYMGAAFFSSARSTGVGFWGSTAYAFLGSLVWEVLMEVDRPSINDQISTSLGGVILGEAKHRFSRALLWNADGWWRKGLAALVNPVAAFNHYLMGTSVQNTRPPSHFATVGIGYNTVGEQALARGMSRSRLFNQLHLALSASYGLPGDATFVPTAPFDHMDVVAELDVSDTEVFGTLFLRGLVKGDAFGGDKLRGIWGLFGSYDFFNPSGYRVSALSIGVGSSVQARLGTKGFVQGTAVVSAVPFGAAGTTDDPDKNYNWGPGAAQLLELRVGRAGTGMLRFTTRGYQIIGDVFNEGTEMVNHTSVTGLLRLWGSHALGAEVVGSLRRANFEGHGLDLANTAGQIRVFYAFASDSRFGAVLDN